jgi:hypothetical protein
MRVAIIIIVRIHDYYNLAATSLFDSVAAFSLASLGLTFSLVALIRLGSSVWHKMAQALTRRWHPANCQRGC